jgi:two-component system, chemotaxis family, protein-glutamate methylesterase/glutaminase
MPKRDVIVVGASTGGLQALRSLMGGLPQNLPAAVLIVWHISPYHESVLPELLTQAGPLPAHHARNGETLEPGRIYVAPPDHHLVLEANHVRVTRGPKENRVRPAVDPLFRSAAYTFGPRVIGVVLTGALDDGTAGLWAIKDRGGIAVVQDPKEAEQPSMPQSALRHVAVDYCLSVAEIASTLASLAGATVAEGVKPVSEKLETETRIALGEEAARDIMKLGDSSVFTCPDCHGTLFSLKDGDLLRFRCHTGHAFSVKGLFAAQSETVEDALWNALRTVQENVVLLGDMVKQAREAGDDDLARSVSEQAQTAERQLELVREAVLLKETRNIPR